MSKTTTTEQTEEIVGIDIPDPTWIDEIEIPDLRWWQFLLVYDAYAPEVEDLQYNLTDRQFQELKDYYYTRDEGGENLVFTPPAEWEGVCPPKTLIRAPCACGRTLHGYCSLECHDITRFGGE